jgi:hypothetical protein
MKNPKTEDPKTEDPKTEDPKPEGIRRTKAEKGLSFSSQFGFRKSFRTSRFGIRISGPLN